MTTDTTRALPIIPWPAKFAGRSRLAWAVEADIASMVTLANECQMNRAPNDPEKDFQRMVATRESGVLIATVDDELAAMTACGYDGRRGYISYVACALRFRGTGLMPALLDAAENWIAAQGAPRTLLFVRRTDDALVEYYRERGYAVDESVYLMVKAM
jgi:ribosomal protein S18 acetylase RimI-like enzyme